MALDIDDLFEADPESERKRKTNTFTVDYDAEMKGGYFDATEKKVKNLTEFLFKFNNPDTASAFAELFAGTPVEDENSSRQFNIDLFSSAGEVEGFLSADNIVCDMRKIEMGKLTHHCTGAKFLSHPLDKSLIGTPCGCPKTLKQRKAAANAGIGPSPYIEFKFRLAKDEEFKVKYDSKSWNLLKEIRGIVGEIIAAGKGGDAWVSFSKEPISWENDKGESLSAVIPKVEVKGSYAQAVESPAEAA